MTERQGKLFVASFMTATIGGIIAGPILAVWLNDPSWLLFLFLLALYL
jgi:hypothetical protein